MREEANVNKKYVYVMEREREKRSVLFFIQNGLGIKLYVWENKKYRFFFSRYLSGPTISAHF